MSASPVGIDDLSVYVPQLYFPIEDLAAARNLSYPKLSKGLGLQQMAIADAREDAATMAANAVLDLMHKNDLDPNDIGRLYLGTESALDGAKPTATYVLEMLQDHFSDSHGGNCFLNCDVVDLTFACIGAVDALQNSLEWAAAKDGRIGIVVASDEAKYEMNSPGEYTQGAGAVAMIVKQNPRLLAIDPDFGVATRPAHDFFKPNRKVTKREIINEVLNLLPDTSAEDFDVDGLIGKLSEGLDCNGVLDCNENDLYLHKVTPVFDGPYSNEAYQARIREALQDYRRRSGKKEGELLTDFSHLVFHLPYAFQARRMFSEIFMEELKANGGWVDFILKNELEVPCADDYSEREEYLTKCTDFLRLVTKSEDYKAFVNERIAPGEWASSRVGNLYAGSVFLSLMSTLEALTQDAKNVEGQSICVFAYGSGSKSKVFGATLQAGWKEVAQQFDLELRLDQRQAIDYAAYEQLHRSSLKDNIAHSDGGSFFLADVHDERDETEGVRHYGYASALAGTFTA
ncbi:hydroxymethylglutaryl-CoA synthase family protein [Neolewinella aurantiaca]|uniref:Hydroxymethylglutaryl-CoA synthase family protein n=1 Tax=Neolewinella aurantiaca TaxID=2602767 RepID=A0A5C7FLE1_9BACT|nr:hydroxymethylglutaryl-CoA synthase [Neolewinella aurantiaca]TXF88204.1 hydroxymethylglutaryl-CoA synthase family protein [Neolewinella aurantiaca]